VLVLQQHVLIVLRVVYLFIHFTELFSIVVLHSLILGLILLQCSQQLFFHLYTALYLTYLYCYLQVVVQAMHVNHP
jgi:hypothetical protein